MPRTDAGEVLALFAVSKDVPHQTRRRVMDFIPRIEAEAHAQGRAEALAAVRAAVEGLRCNRSYEPLPECRDYRCELHGGGYEHELLPAVVLAAIDNLEG